MSNYQVTRFNHIVGNAPSEDMETWWKQVQSQAAFILEEAQEQYDAAMERDIVEVLDGNCDVNYLQAYMDDLLKYKGIDTRSAFQAVCDNNNAKFTQSDVFAHESSLNQIDKGVDCKVVKSSFEQEDYFIVKRSGDGKVLKLIGHVPPNLKEFIPDELLEYANT